MAGVTSLGLGSGLDIRGIVDGLVAAESRPKEFQLAQRETDLQAKLSSFGIFKSALSDVRSSLAGLRSSDSFGKLTANTSDEEVVTASAASNAETGSYTVESKQLAQAHSLASDGFEDSNAIVGSGTLTIKFGTKEITTDELTGDETYTGFQQNSDQGTLTIELDETNNTLIGMRDAINAQDAGVSASIIFDGSAYRLVMSADDTGAENSLEITVDDPSLSQFEYNSTNQTMTETREAQDAIMSINGLDVTNSSNTFDKTLKGVSIDLQKVELGKSIQIDVERSTAGASEALEGFIEKYNELVNSVKSLTAYDTETQTASALLGDGTVRTGMAQIRSVLGNVVSGLENSSVRTLADIGVTTQSDGTLKLDSSKLNSALTDDPEGVAAIFTVIGRTDHENVSYLSSSDETESGEYSINITQVATQGELIGANNSIAGLTVTEGNNDSFKIRVDGTLSGDVTLTAGTYASGDELAAEIQSRINGDSTLRSGGVSVQVAYDSDNNRFEIKSTSFGSESTLEITESTAGGLGLSVATGTDGVDIAGTIDGEEAEGKGQTLTGANALELFIDGDQVGDYGTVSFSRGLMEKFDSVLAGMLDSDGTLSAKTEGLQKSLSDIETERTKLQDKVAKFEERLLKKFNAMDSLLGRVQTTGSFLSQQLATLPYNNLSKNK